MGGDLHLAQVELQAAQEVIIVRGNVTQFRVRLIILNVGLDPRRVFLQFHPDLPLIGNDAIRDGSDFRWFPLLIGFGGLRSVTPRG